MCADPFLGLSCDDSSEPSGPETEEDEHKNAHRAVHNLNQLLIDYSLQLLSRMNSLIDLSFLKSVN